MQIVEILKNLLILAFFKLFAILKKSPFGKSAKN